MRWLDTKNTVNAHGLGCNAAQVAFKWPWLTPLVQGLGFVALLLLLNAVLSFKAIWPTVYIAPSPQLSFEFVVLLVGLSVWVAKRGRPAAWFVGSLAGFYLLMGLAHYADVVVPNLLGRPVNLYWDFPQLPRFLWVTAQGLPWWVSAAVVASTVAVVWVLHRILVWAFEGLMDGLCMVTKRLWWWLVLCVPVGVVAVNYATVPEPGSVLARPVVPNYSIELSKLWDMISPERAARLLPDNTVINEALTQPEGTVLPALAGRDLTVMFLETYGAVLYDQPESFNAVQATRQQLEESILASGRHVVSAFYKSPTIGGASDLAHMSLLAGMDLTDSRKHDVLLTTDRPTLIDLFRREGYETFGVYHSVGWDWTERSYYNYDVYLSGPDLNYQGPAFGFWKIPDQFAAAKVDVLFPRTDDAKPRFKFFPTISTHFPFHQVPPYQSDWSKLLGPQPYDPIQAAKAQAEPVNWDNMKPDYLRSINYAHTWLAGYFKQPEPRESVYVMIGDHQPTGSVSRQATPWDVPVFLVSKDNRLLDRFRAMGFTNGMTPKRREPLGGMHDLTGVLLNGFGLEKSTTRFAKAAP